MTKVVGKKRGPKGPSKWTDKKIEEEAEALENYIQTAPIPFLEKFCVDRGYYPEIISRKFKDNEKFSQALKKAKAVLKYKLISGGLAGRFNPAMAIFTLKNVSDMRDKQEHKHSGEISHELFFDEVIRKGKKRMKDDG